MSNSRYLEIESSYRNRNEFPNPSNFNVLIAQSGTRDRFRAYDPVSNEAPIIEWTVTDIQDGEVVTNIANTTTRFLACFPQITPTQPSTIPKNRRLDYYRGMAVTIPSPGDDTLIVSSEYVNTNVGGDDCFWINVFPALSAVPTNPDAVDITPTQIFDITNGLFWVPTSFQADQFYTESVLWNDRIQEAVDILSFDGDTHMVGVDPALVDATQGGLWPWVSTDNISIRKKAPQLSGLLPAQVGLLSNQVAINPASNMEQAYTGGFIRFSNPVSGAGNEGVTCRIVNYTPDIITFTCDPGVTLVTPAVGNGYEILQFTRDNAVPFNYTGSMVSQQEMVCYEIELINLVLPNTTLESGGRVAFYPYVYVELQNVSGASAGTQSVIYSNNPHSKRMLFRAAIDDIPNPLLSPFVKIDGDGMVQTVKFKPNDNLKFGVYLPNGEQLETVIKDNMSPVEPNPLVQLSPIFSIKRL